jgi:hypothetical protein
MQQLKQQLLVDFGGPFCPDPTLQSPRIKCRYIWEAIHEKHLHSLHRNTGWRCDWGGVGRDLLIPAQAAHHNEMMSPAVTE